MDNGETTTAENKPRKVRPISKKMLAIRRIEGHLEGLSPRERAAVIAYFVQDSQDRLDEMHDQKIIKCDTDGPMAHRSEDY